VKTQVDSCPSDGAGNDVKKNSVTREPCCQKGCHHEYTKAVSTWKTGVQNFSLTFRKLSDRFQKYQRSSAVDEKFDAVSDCGLNGIKEKEMEEDLLLLRQKPGHYNKNPDCIMAPQIGDPGDKPI
jgi:hypothetical protein